MQQPPQESRRRGHIISDKAWERYRQMIELLVGKERWILKDVVQYMADKCDFVASPQQYSRKLESWGIEKNLTSADWSIIGYKVSKRKREWDKDSEVSVNGKVFDAKRIKTKSNYAKDRSHKLMNSNDPLERTYYASRDYGFAESNASSFGGSEQVIVSPKTPQNVSVYTPGEKLQIDLEKIPWFGLEKKLDELLAISKENWSNLNLQTLGSMASRATNPSRLILHDRSLVHSNIPDAYACLEAIHLQRQKGQFWDELQAASQSSENNLVFCLKRAIQLSSNKVLSDYDMDRLLDSFANAGQLAIIKTVCSLDLLSARAFAESVLCSAARRFKYTELVQHLLATKKVRPDLPSPVSGSLFCDALENMSPYGVDIGIIRCFLDAGVDVERGKPKTPLNTAIWFLPDEDSETLEAVDLFIRRNANINGRSLSSETTPLQTALLFNYEFDAYRSDALALVDLLIEAGADVNARPAEGYITIDEGELLPVYSYTALQLATTLRHGMEYPSKIRNPGFGQRVNYTKKKDYIAIVRTLLKCRAYVNAPASDYYGRTALQGAAEAGCDAVIQDLLEAGADVNAAASEHEGLTALQAAAFNGYETIVQTLLDHGADVNAPAGDVGGRTALEAGIEAVSPSIITLLLEHEANPNSMGSLDSRRSPLQVIISFIKEDNEELEFLKDFERIKLEIVDILLKSGADPHLKYNYCEDPSPIEMALSVNNRHLTSLLLPLENAIVSPQDSILINDNFTRRIVKNQLCSISPADVKLKAIQRLFMKGARVNENEMETDDSLLQLAYMNRDNHSQSQMFQLLIDLGCGINAPPSIEIGETVLQIAVSRALYGDPSVEYPEILSLIRLGADVNGPPAVHGGRTTLQMVADSHCRRSLQLLTILIGNGADPNAPTARYHGITPLQAAASQGDVAMLKALLKAKADVNANAPPPSGKTALQEACAAGSIEVVKLLLEHGANVNAMPSPSGGRTALQGACAAGSIEVVKLLLGHGANVNAMPSPSGGRTALQAAAEFGNMDLIRLLPEKGKAKVNMEPAPHRGVTALQAAAIQGFTGIVAYLLDKGADPNAPAAATEGRTALDGAAERGRLDVVKILLECKASLRRKSSFMPVVPAEDDSEEEWVYDCSNAIKLAREEGHNVVAGLLLEYHDPSVFHIPQEMLPMDDFNGIPIVDFPSS